MIDLVRRGQSSVYGQVSDVAVKGQTWTNRAGIGDTSPQTIENLDSAKTYLLIKTDGGTVNVDAVDTAVPAKITGKTSTVLTWASGKIALYELSTAEAALTETQLGARYHYVSGTKSTNSVRVKSVGKNLFDSDNAPSFIHSSCIYTKIDNGFNLSGSWYASFSIKPLKKNTYYTLSATTTTITGTPAIRWVYKYTDGTLGGQSGIGSRKITDASKTVDGILVYVTITYDVTASCDYTNIQLEEASTATTYEPYKESSVIINLPEPLRSVPSANDEFNVTTGVKTKNVSDTVDFKNMTGWTREYDQTNTIRFAKVIGVSNFIANTGTLRIGSWDVPAITPAASLTDIEGWFLHTDGRVMIRVLKSKLSTVDSAGFEAYLQANGTALNYQLAEPVVTQLDPQPLTIFPNGTQYIEFGTKEVAEYADGINISNAEIPIKAMKTVDKLHIEDGHWKRTAIDLANVAVSPDGLSFTIVDAVNGDTYEYSYDYDSALSTMPDLEVGEPSLVTRNNRTIVL
jgi:hypothetical protein